MQQKQFNKDIILLILAVVVILGLGAILFSLLEGWSMIDSLYFVTMTAATVGYGDLTPSTPASKLITILFAVSIVPFVMYAFSTVAKAQAEKVYSKIHHLEQTQKRQEEELNKAERKLMRQKSLIKQQQAEISEHQANLKKQTKTIQEQEKELEVHDKELELVEDIMEEALVK